LIQLSLDPVSVPLGHLSLRESLGGGRSYAGPRSSSMVYECFGRGS
jgi:hypothetical protein